MKIEYEITKEDFVRYNLHYIENSKSGKKIVCSNKECKNEKIVEDE